MLANPVQRQPPNVNPATKESLVTKTASPAKNAKQAPFKIKIHSQVLLARRAQQDTTTARLEKIHAKTWATKKHPIVTNFNTSTTPPPTPTIGTALDALLEPPALATSIGAGSKPNSDGQSATTTTLLLNVVFFPGLVWVEKTPP